MPQFNPSPCQRCGMIGIHACTGVIPNMTNENVNKLNGVLNDSFKTDRKELKISEALLAIANGKRLQAKAGHWVYGEGDGEPYDPYSSEPQEGDSLKPDSKK